MSVLLNVGVYQKVFGGADGFSADAPLGLGRAALISVVGVAVVFVVLAVIALFVKALGSGFDRAEKKKRGQAKLVPASPAPEKDKEGKEEEKIRAEVTLIDVTEEEAAMVMAVVAANSGIPPEKLKFNSITRAEEEK